MELVSHSSSPSHCCDGFFPSNNNMHLLQRTVPDTCDIRYSCVYPSNRHSHSAAHPIHNHRNLKLRSQYDTLVAMSLTHPLFQAPTQWRATRPTAIHTYMGSHLPSSRELRHDAPVRCPENSRSTRDSTQHARLESYECANRQAPGGPLGAIDLLQIVIFSTPPSCIHKSCARPSRN